jgi:drug/metabolite transporter (DMT)-like permease
MDIAVFLAVLAAAACHAGWNAVVKGGGDPMVTTTIVSVAAAIVSLPFVPIAGLPAAAAWPWIAASVVVHLFYFGCLIEAYNHGDLGQVYPLARGTAPLMIGMASSLIGEYLTVTAWAGLLLLVGGVLLLALPGRGADARFNWRGIGFALATAGTICAYSIIDGVGARASGYSPAYTLALFIGCGVVMMFYALARRRGRTVFAGTGRRWRIGLLGGIMQVVSYGVANWAMTLAPIAIVAALRETSVLFGSLVAVVVLKEKLHAARIAAAVLIVCGLIVLRIA